MVQIYQKTITSGNLKVLDTFRVGSWIHVENPTEEELRELTEQFSLEPGLLKDALDPYEVPRVEVENDSTYIFTRIPLAEETKYLTIPILIIVGKEFLMTLSTMPLSFIYKFQTEKIIFYTTQKTRLFLQIFSEINLAYNLLLNSISKKIRHISIQIEKIDNKDFIQFVSFESSLNDFLAALVPTNALLQKLLSGKFLRLYEKDKDLTEDLLLANGQLIELCKTNLNTITNIRESYSTIMTNNLNRVIKLLTSLTVILTIPTMIASIYGMNVDLPYSNYPAVFSAIILTTTFISISLLVIFFKKRWL